MTGPVSLASTALGSPSVLSSVSASRRYKRPIRILASGVLMALSVGHTTTDPGTTQFGASVYAGSSSWHSAVERSDDRYGGLEVVRVFYPGMPQPWKSVTSAVDTSLVVSFKADPTRILSGADDERLKQWFADAPRDRDIWWTYYHEPENNVAHGDFTAEQWRAAYKHIATIANAADNPRLHNSIVLMCWTVDPSVWTIRRRLFPGD